MSLKHCAVAALAFSVLAPPAFAKSDALAHIATQWVAVTVSETLCRHGTPNLLDTMQRDLAVGLSGELDEDVERVKFEVGVGRLMRLVLEQAGELLANAQPTDVDCSMERLFVLRQLRAAEDRAHTRLRIKLDGRTVKDGSAI